MEFQIRKDGIRLYAPLVPIEVLADTTVVDENLPLSQDQREEIFRYFRERLEVYEGDDRLVFTGDTAAVFAPDTAEMTPDFFRWDTSPLDLLVVSGHFERLKKSGMIKIDGKELFREMGAYPPMVVGHVTGQGYDEIFPFDGFAPWVEPLPEGVWPKLISAASGIGRIFTGYDHIVLLLGLNLLSSRGRAGLKNILAFVISYLVTFTLASVEIIALPASFVGPVIALTVLYVGAENLLSPVPRDRWRIAILFGLIHGLGAPGTSPHPATGALSVAILLVMAVRSPLQKWIVQGGSVAISMAGLYGLITRVFL